MHYAKATLVSLVLLLHLAGCIPFHPKTNLATVTPTALPTAEQLRQWLDENPCGTLQVRRPLANVSGHLTAPARAGSYVRLFILRNDSLKNALWTVQNCPSIASSPIAEWHQFTFRNLPPGLYAAMLPATAFKEDQGFPVIDESTKTDPAVREHWGGGDADCSLAVFSIQARPQ